MIQLAVGMAVGIILIVGLIWPVVSDSTQEISTIQYNETNRYSSSSGNNVNLVVEVVDSNLTVNGEIINLYNDGTAITIVSESFYVRYDDDGFKIHDVNSSVSSSTITKLIIEGGKYSYVLADSTTSTPQSFEQVIYPDNDGNLGAFSNQNVNVDYNKNVIYSFGGTLSGSVNSVFFIEYGSNGIVDKSVYTFSSGAYNDVSSNSSIVPMGITESDDYYTIDSRMSYTIGDSTGTYGGFMLMYAPLEYHVVTDMDNNIRTMIGVAGMLIVVLMVVMVARNLMD